MNIGGINGNTDMGAGAVGIGNPQMDSYSKNLKKQIEDAQKELQELARDDEMDPDTKMKKRQEIQKQISNLNMQLRQHQMEERRKAQQEKLQQNEQKSQETNRTEKSKEKAAGLSQNNMQAMLSAESSIKQAKIHGGTANQMENESNIKRTEIKLEGGGSTRTANDNVVVSKKWDEAEGMEQKAQAASASQASLLAETQHKLEKANERGSTDTGREEKNEENAIGSNVDIRL